jgi:hypothetical protein
MCTGFLDGTVAVVWHGVLAVPACHWQMAEALVATFGFWIGGMCVRLKNN